MGFRRDGEAADSDTLRGVAPSVVVSLGQGRRYLAHGEFLSIPL